MSNFPGEHVGVRKLSFIGKICIHKWLFTALIVRKFKIDAHVTAKLESSRNSFQNKALKPLTQDIYKGFLKRLNIGYE